VPAACEFLYVPLNVVLQQVKDETPAIREVELPGENRLRIAGKHRLNLLKPEIFFFLILAHPVYKM